MFVVYETYMEPFFYFVCFWSVTFPQSGLFLYKFGDNRTFVQKGNVVFVHTVIMAEVAEHLDVPDDVDTDDCMTSYSYIYSPDLLKWVLCMVVLFLFIIRRHKANVAFRQLYIWHSVWTYCLLSNTFILSNGTVILVFIDTIRLAAGGLTILP